MKFSGNFVEEPEAKMEKLDEGNGDHEGMSAWAIGVWVTVLICAVVIIGIFGFLKKSIE